MNILMWLSYDFIESTSKWYFGEKITEKALSAHPLSSDFTHCNFLFMGRLKALFFFYHELRAW